MPRYFFDIDDGRHFTRDETGADCAGRLEMRDAAIAVLPEVAREHRLGDDRHDVSVRVRDANQRYIFQATLSLKSEWLA